MTDFALYFLNRWKAGQGQPELDAHQVVYVYYDQTTSAYEVKPSDMDDFIDWVSEIFPDDHSPREMNEEGEYLESAVEHLDRVDCTVTVQ